MKNSLTVYRLDADRSMLDIEPMNMQRSWMHKTTNKFAYKCLPLGIANQYGWQVLSPVNFSVSWFGGEGAEAVSVDSDDDSFEEYRKIFHSHFGNGVFTINPDFLIRTPEQYSLYIRGVPNKDYGVLQPLDAIVETDWLSFTFSYNFRFTEPGTVFFKKGDSLFSFFPIERMTVETFDIIEDSIFNNSELLLKYKEHSSGRELSNKNGVFQRFYLNGLDSFGNPYDIKNHLKKIMFSILRKRQVDNF
jgi:hypothetical protein